MTATKPKSTNLSVVDRGETSTAPDPKTATVEEQVLDTVESAMEEISKEQRPLVQRAETRRQRITQEAQEVEGLLHDLSQREGLLDRLVAAAKLAIKQQRDDLEEELGLLNHGLVGAPRAQEPSNGE